MSDFDKEKEREKLREKYESDREDREIAERMSELLLQGATMTNAHCSECGDPIFRYDGQEFCATCERAVDRGADGSDGADGDDRDADGPDAENIEVTDPDAKQVQFGAGSDGAGDTDPAGSSERSEARGTSERSEPPEDVAAVDDGADSAESPAGTSPSGPAADDPAGARQGTDPARESLGRTGTPDAAHREGTTDREPTTTDRAGADEVSAARSSLVRTLTHFAERAEATDEPGRAREHLAAAREAAEALAALRW